MRVHKLRIVEAPIPDPDPIGNLEGTLIPITLQLDFDKAGDSKLIRSELLMSSHMSWVLSGEDKQFRWAVMVDSKDL